MTQEELVDKAIALAKKAWPNVDGVMITCLLGVSNKDGEKVYNRNRYEIKTWVGLASPPQIHMSASSSLEELIEDLEHYILK